MKGDMKKHKPKIITPSSLRGIAIAPPSKSYTHRAIISASLAEGKSKIINYLRCEDTKETIEALKLLGAKIKEAEAEGVLEIEGTENFDNGNLPYFDGNKLFIDCIKYSGSSLRFLIPVAASLKTKKQFDVVFSIEGRLKERPIEPLLQALRKLGVKCTTENPNSSNMFVVIHPGIKGGKTDIPGNISSQFISGLLLACPRAESDTEITITTALESKNYIDLTLDVLKDFGIKVKASTDLRKLRKFNIPGDQHYKAKEFKVEGDYSSAAFFLAAGAINGDVEVKGLNINSKQGDKEILKILKRMGAEIEIKQDSIRVKKSDLKGIKIDGKNIPDLIPICAVLCCFAEGESIITNAKRLRIKESDRLAAITSELNKMGAKIKELEDGLVIHGKCKLNGAEIEPHNDHRIAMACAIAALSASGETKINNPECVSKSYPNFFEDLDKLKLN